MITEDDPTFVNMWWLCFAGDADNCSLRRMLGVYLKYETHTMIIRQRSDYNVAGCHFGVIENNARILNQSIECQIYWNNEQFIMYI